MLVAAAIGGEHTPLPAVHLSSSRFINRLWRIAGDGTVPRLLVAVMRLDVFDPKWADSLLPGGDEWTILLALKPQMRHWPWILCLY